MRLEHFLGVFTILTSSCVSAGVVGRSPEEAAQAKNEVWARGDISNLTPSQVNGGSMITEAPDPTVTDNAAHLEKRMNRNYVSSKRKQLLAAFKSKHGVDMFSSAEPAPDPWVRTIYETMVEIVTPTVVQGVTISGKPPATTNGLEPWITLKKDGSPKTVKPELKNGHLKNPSPTYGTWFATPTTVRYTKEQLKAHNMADDDIHQEVQYIEEDQTYHVLNPIVRCTPDSYFKKGLNKQLSSEPFCFPKDNTYMAAGKSYFVTWYSKYFEADKVRFHLSDIRESQKDKGTIKQKRSAIMDKGGKVSRESFFKSDWIDNDAGMYPLKIQEEFFGPEEIGSKRVLLSIQPDDVPDEEFDLIKNSLVISISKPKRSRKKEKHYDLKFLEEKQKYKDLLPEVDEGLDYEEYYAMMIIPLCVCIFAVFMYLFITVNKVDLSHLKPRRPKGLNHGHKRIPFKRGGKSGYSTLPQYASDPSSSGIKSD